MTDLLPLERDRLAEYLHDHMAGAATASDLLAHRLERDPDRELEQVLDDIRGERQLLSRLVEDLELSAGAAKQVAGWLAEKASRVKLDLERLRSSPMADLLELEVLQVGIAGKRALWVALQGIADAHPRLEALPLEDLIAAAEAQAAVVQRKRVAAARATFLQGG